MFGKKDIVTAKFLIRKTFEESELPDEEKLRNMEQDLKRLYKMIDYCQTPVVCACSFCPISGRKYPGAVKTAGIVWLHGQKKLKTRLPRPNVPGG